VAVIPTYRPDADDLRRLITALKPQVSAIVIADDASPCSADRILAEAARSESVTVVRHRRNAGIARSLNAGLALARTRAARWLLTVDQDTDIPTDYVARLLEAFAAAEAALGADAVGAVAAEGLDDASGEVDYPVRVVADVPTTDEVFQTGTLWSIDALNDIGGFDERLGIDGVDAAACLRLRQRGLVVVLASGVRLSHHYGTGTQYRILGRDVVSTGHSPARRESMVRNRLRLLPAEFGQSPRHAFRTIRRLSMNTVLGITVEDGRWENLKGSTRGLLPRRNR